MEKLKYVWEHREAIAAAFIAAATAYTVFVATPLSRIIKRPPPSASWWKRLLYDLAIDTPSWLAAVERSGIFGGIFNVPGVPSRTPDQNPTPAASKLMRMRRDEESAAVPPAGGSGGGGGGGTVIISSSWRGDNDSPGGTLLAMLLALGFAGMLVAAAGCGTTGAQALGHCELNTLPQQLEGLLARVISAAFTSGTDWNQQLEQAAASAAPGQGSCVIQAALGWLEDLTNKKGAPTPANQEARKRLRGYLDTHAPAACGRLLFDLHAIRDPDHMLFGGGGASTTFRVNGESAAPYAWQDGFNQGYRFYSLKHYGQELWGVDSRGAVYVLGLRVM